MTRGPDLTLTGRYLACWSEIPIPLPSFARVGGDVPPDLSSGPVSSSIPHEKPCEINGERIGPARAVRHLIGQKLSERWSLAIAGMSASAFRYEPRLDANVELREMVCSVANRHTLIRRPFDLGPT